MSQPEQYYEMVQNLLKLTPWKQTWASLCSDLFHIPNPLPIDQLKNEECRVFYEQYSMENEAWTTSLILMSWVLRNFQRKVANGHCNNTVTHEHGEREPRNCEQGRQFHREMLNRCIQSYRNTLTVFDTPTQEPTGTQNNTTTSPTT